jgi:hypothetical protein
VPFLWLNWAAEWVAFVLSKWSVLELAEYVGSISILFGVIFYFADAGNREKQKHYQAWQVINTAEGKGGNGGRFEALQDLSEDHVPLVGVDLSGGAFLEKIRLEKTDMRRCDLRGADLKDSDLRGSDIEDSKLQDANLRNADLRNINFSDSSLDDADLNGADLSGADLEDVFLSGVDLRGANLAGVLHWQDIHDGDLSKTDIAGVRNAPDGFVDWAKKHGAVEMPEDTIYYNLLETNNAPAAGPSSTKP